MFSTRFLISKSIASENLQCNSECECRCNQCKTRSILGVLLLLGRGESSFWQSRRSDDTTSSDLGRKSKVKFVCARVPVPLRIDSPHGKGETCSCSLPAPPLLSTISATHHGPYFACALRLSRGKIAHLLRLDLC